MERYIFTREYTRENGAILWNATNIVEVKRTGEKNQPTTVQWKWVNRKQFILIYRRGGDDVRYTVSIVVNANDGNGDFIVF